MFRREFSLALILIWFTAGVIFTGAWYLTAGEYPPLWARLVGVGILFPVLVPLETALARRSERRREGAS